MQTSDCWGVLITGYVHLKSTREALSAKMRLVQRVKYKQKTPVQNLAGRCWNIAESTEA